jgi:hypothetical protein
VTASGLATVSRGCRGCSSTLLALHQLHLDAPSPPGSLVKHCAAWLSDGQYTGLYAFAQIDQPRVGSHGAQRCTVATENDAVQLRGTG